MTVRVSSVTTPTDDGIFGFVFDNCYRNDEGSSFWSRVKMYGVPV